MKAIKKQVLCLQIQYVRPIIADMNYYNYDLIEMCLRRQIDFYTRAGLRDLCDTYKISKEITFITFRVLKRIEPISFGLKIIIIFLKVHQSPRYYT